MYQLWKDPEGKTVFLTKTGNVRDFRSHPSQGDGGTERGKNEDSGLESSEKGCSDIKVEINRTF